MENTTKMEPDEGSGSERMQISAREYGALFDIRGLQESAYFMVMTANRKPDGSYMLVGSPKAFDELRYDLSEEIEFELSAKSKLRHLAKIYDRLSPDDF